jgi:hypothetical protein
MRRLNLFIAGDTKSLRYGMKKHLKVSLLCLCFIAVLFAGAGHSAQVTLSWDPNSESDLGGYRIYYGTGTRTYNWFVDVGKVTTHTITGLADGSTYYFTATAYDTSHHESTYSNEVSISTCTYSITPMTASMGQQGGTGTLQVITQNSCSWRAVSGASWLTITSGSQGTGNGTVSYSAAANTGASIRTVASTIAGKVFTVTQAGINTPLANKSPIATIDSITPNPATTGQKITFTGHGADTDGTVTAYEWTSSINGLLSTASSFSTSSLSAGTHTISFRVKDDDGAWSNPLKSSVTVSGGSATQLILASTYSVDLKNNGTKYYHDGNDWVGRGSSGSIRAVNRWDISGINPSWNIISVEVRFYAESKTGSPGAISLNRYGSSHGEDNPQADAGTLAYTKINNTPYASLPEPSSGSWTSWVNLGSMAASDIAWCRDFGLSTWSLGLKASDAIETSSTVRHADFSEDNESNDAELRITYKP